MSLLRDLWSGPQTISAASKYTVVNGLFYFLSGAVVVIWPGEVLTVYREGNFAGHEADLMRVIGLLLAIVGWLYIFGGRSGGRQFVAATVVDRIVFLPLVLVPVALSGVFPNLFLTFSVLDPTLAIGAWVLLRRTAG